MNATLLGRGLAVATLAYVLGSGAIAVAQTATATATASGTATVRVVHGIPGRDVAPTADPQLPVDVLVNNSLCVLKDFAFGSVSAPLTLPVGTYNIKVSLANTITPCSNAAVIDQSVTVTANEEAAVVAALPGGKPVLDAFALDLRAITKGGGRVIVAHAADAPAVAVSVNGTVAFKALHPGKEGVAQLAANTYQVSVAANGKPVFGPVPLIIQNNAVTVVFAVGAPGKGTFDLISTIIPGVV